MDGGQGNDFYMVDNPGDVVTDSGGNDTVWARDISYTLPAGIENGWLNNGEPESGNTLTGNELDNVLDGTHGGWNYTFDGAAGNDTLIGSGRSVRLLGGAGDDTLIDRGATYATLDGGDGNDLLVGSGYNGDTMIGGAGNDTLVSGQGPDSMTGGLGADVFVIDYGPDRITDFQSGVDHIRLDGRAMPDLGAGGDFAPNDERFYSAAGATSGHDATDRLVYDTSTGNLYYDADGRPSPALRATIRSPAAAATIRSAASPATTRSSASAATTRWTAARAPTRWSAATATTPTSSTTPAMSRWSRTASSAASTR
jgi:Ca2+-binding RTX toxin-like protein